ncbi:uncharacterized protein [Palaemon carinicauda]|uniref:uncharacterized protein isoform X2 n=1 Tax=Palaemon carinicauda TaxID=392227 RepID=UPI0035B6901C
MVRNPLELAVTPPLHPTEEEERDCGFCQETTEIQQDFKSPTGKSTGLSPVHSSDRPSAESTTEGCVRSLEKICIKRSKRSTEIDTDLTAIASKAVVKGQEPNKDNSLTTTSTFSGHPHRGLTGRMGRPFPSKKSTRELVTPVQDLSHQHSGSHDSLPNVEETIPSEISPHQAGLGQRSNSEVSEPTRLEIALHQSRDVSHLSLSKEENMALISSSPARVPQCDGRRSIQAKTDRDRMVLGRRLILLNLGKSPRTADRPLRNKQQQETTSICGPIRGPSGRSGGRHVPRLEQMELYLSVPTNKSPAEGPQQAEILEGNSSNSGPQMAQEQLVPPSDRTEAEAVSSIESSSIPTGSEVDCLRFIIENPKPTSHDFLALAVKKRFGISKDNINFIEEYKSKSTRRQYESS